MAGCKETGTSQQLITDRACPICGGQDYILLEEICDQLVSGQLFPLLRCRHCGLIITGNAPKKEELGHYYRNKAYVSHSNTNQGLINKLYHYIRHFTLKRKYHLIKRLTNGRKGISLLDVGAGTGHFAALMKKKGYAVSCVEQDSEARLFMEHNFSLNASPYLNDISIPVASQEVITLWHVLEHIPDLENHFSLFRKLLTAGGFLILALPNPSGYDAAHYGKDWAAYDVPRHLWHFSPELICRLAEKEGFTLVEKHIMPFDAYYIALLSEQRRNNKGLRCYFKAFTIGLKTNLKARRQSSYASALTYVFRLT